LTEEKYDKDIKIDFDSDQESEKENNDFDKFENK